MAQRKTTFEATAKASRIPQGFTILGFGRIHFILEENIVRCLESQLRLDGHLQGRKIEIIPRPQGAVLVKISTCPNAAQVNLDDHANSVKDKLRIERWQTIAQYLVKNGQIEEHTTPKQ